MMSEAFIVVILLFLVHCNYGQLTPRYLGAINITLPGFSNPFEHDGWIDPTERYSLLLATFSGVPFTIDSTYMLHHVGKHLNNLDQVKPTLLHDEFIWPRSISQTPLDVFGFDAVTQPYGFLPFGKTNGSIAITDIRDLANPLTYDIGRDPLDDDSVMWFYQDVTWKDINSDGRLDAMTCRVSTNGLEPGDAELIWFEHPASDPLGPQWTLHHINTGVCGTFQYDHVFDIPGEGPVYALFTVGYFTQLFAVHWSTDPAGSWEDPAMIQTRTIDTEHKFFYIDLVDVNNDGRLDLLMTWNKAENGSFVAYEIPDDFRTGEYILHILAEGFSANSGATVAGTPGIGSAFYPSADETGKPLIVLSGDDDGKMYYLQAETTDPLDWNYDLITMYDAGDGQIMAQATTIDVDGDGYKEVFVPVYYEYAVRVYTFAP